jgi:GntR family transcriptional regulator
MSKFSELELRSVAAEHAAPLYHQLFLLLKQKIVVGDYRFGELLPSEIELAGEFNLSRITTKRALDELQEQGLVERRRGRGTQVSYRYEPKILRAPLNSMLENLNVMGRETTVDVLQFAEIDAARNVADTLKIAAGSKVYRAVRLRRHQGEAFAYYTSFTIKLAPLNGFEFSAKSLKQQTRLELFRGLGVQLAEVDQQLTAVAADVDVAAALEVPVGSPLLSLTRLYVDREQRPIDWLHCLYRPDRFQYQMRLTATSTGPGARILTPMSAERKR